MGRMVFHIIPRDGKPGVWFGEAVKYDFSGVGRYELYIDDYATDVCEGEMQTARRAWCEDASAVLAMFAEEKKFGLNADCTLGELQRIMSGHIADIDEFMKICDYLKVKFEQLPMLVERHDL